MSDEDVHKAMSSLIVETFRLNGAIVGAGDRLVGDLGLTSARWQVLGALALSPVPLTVPQVARNMGLSRQAVLRLVDEMEEDGMVHLASNPHHQRARLVLLTKRGEGAYAAAMQRQKPWAEELAEGLPGRRIAEAARTLRAIRERAEARSQAAKVNKE